NGWTATRTRSERHHGLPEAQCPQGPKERSEPAEPMEDKRLRRRRWWWRAQREKEVGHRHRDRRGGRGHPRVSVRAVEVGRAREGGDRGHRREEGASGRERSRRRPRQGADRAQER